VIENSHYLISKRLPRRSEEAHKRCLAGGGSDYSVIRIRHPNLSIREKRSRLGHWMDHHPKVSIGVHGLLGFVVGATTASLLVGISSVAWSSGVFGRLLGVIFALVSRRRRKKP
jgi:hypothetical protein